LFLTFLAPNSLPCADGAVKNLLTHSIAHPCAQDTDTQTMLCATSVATGCIYALCARKATHK